MESTKYYDGGFEAQSLQVEFPAACGVGRSKIGSLERRRLYPAPWGGKLDSCYVLSPLWADAFLAALLAADARQSARIDRWSVLFFRDPTGIRLAIIIAVAAKATGSMITIAQDVTEAEIILDVPEPGSDGIMVAHLGAEGDATALKAVSPHPMPSPRSCRADNPHGARWHGHLR
ncbi:3-dehydroquinate synthase II [Paraburkholderia aspalathi]|uniref:3-dehydroquinate synthase II n=1 Tax=Paraburkholderia aspalathi TaxID=1324617 RepID=UPI0038B9FB80